MCAVCALNLPFKKRSFTSVTSYCQPITLRPYDALARCPQKTQLSKHQTKRNITVCNIYLEIMVYFRPDRYNNWRFLWDICRAKKEHEIYMLIHKGEMDELHSWHSIILSKNRYFGVRRIDFSLCLGKRTMLPVLYT